jgi:beta-hydroxylase
MKVITRRIVSALIFVTFLLVLVVFVFCFEPVRRQGAVPLLTNEFYRSIHFPLAPYTLWCSSRSVDNAPPYPDMMNHFPRHEVLQKNWEVIRDEALAIYTNGQSKPIKGELFFTRIADEGWKRFYIKWYGPSGADARALCPRTCALLDTLPEVHLAMFSILEPGSEIIPHRGPLKGCLRYHLGLNCPPEARMLVDGLPYSWREGHDILFDDTYVHEVTTGLSTQPRVILFCDVERTMVDKFSHAVNRSIIRTVGPITTRSNDKTEHESRS